MKKLLAAVITLMMLIGCVIIAAFPTSAVEINYDEFDIYEREEDAVVGTVTYKAGLWIAEYIGEDKEVIVPSIDPDGQPIMGIDSKAFVNNKTIETLYICEGLEQIADETFKMCVMLQHVSLPYSLTTLGTSNVFQYTSITSMVIPGQVKEIPCCLVQAAGVDRGGIKYNGFNDFVISYGVQQIKTGALFYDGTEPLIFPSTMTDIRGACDTYRHTGLDIYILNPKCNVGTLLGDWNGYKPNTDNNDASYPYKVKKGSVIPPIMIWGDNGVIKIHGPKNSVLKEQVKQWNAEYKVNGHNVFEFIEMTDAEVKEKDQWTKDNGIIKSTGWEMDANDPGVVYKPGEKKSETAGDVDDDDEIDEDDVDETTSGGNSAKKKSKTKNGNGTVNEDGTIQSGGYDLDLTPVFIVVGAFLFLIIVLIVVVIIIMSNKKKNKKAEKQEAAEASEAEPEIEVENLEETPADKE